MEAAAEARMKKDRGRAGGKAFFILLPTAVSTLRKRVKGEKGGCLSKEAEGGGPEREGRSFHAWLRKLGTQREKNRR